MRDFCSGAYTSCGWNVCYLFQCPRGKAGHYLLLQQEEKNENRDHEDRRESHHVVPVCIFRAYEAVDTDGARLHLLPVEKRQRIDELTVGLREDRSEEHTSELQSLRHLVCR